jgi:hypothetical protein
MKSIRVKEETHRRLLRIMGLLQARDGKRKTVEDAKLASYSYLCVNLG